MICGKEKIVFSAGDEETGKVVTLCEGCAKDIGDVSTSEVIEKHGKVDKEAFKNEGAINVMGLDKLQKKLEEKQEKDQEKRQKKEASE